MKIAQILPLLLLGAFAEAAPADWKREPESEPSDATSTTRPQPTIKPLVWPAHPWKRDATPADDTPKPRRSTQPSASQQRPTRGW
ncbi:hypothetical protein TWF481_000608 [Arthrobotrys musiformis]|uniref:Uncharacterized protein n=1 Tax=Arthrobotrys musiformis TaxID=47236 RepID=A0AAV9WN30_9PEZI